MRKNFDFYRLATVFLYIAVAAVAAVAGVIGYCLGAMIRCGRL